MPRPRIYKTDSDRARAHDKRMADKGAARKTIYLTTEGANALAKIQKATGKKIGASINDALVALAAQI